MPLPEIANKKALLAAVSPPLLDQGVLEYPPMTLPSVVSMMVRVNPLLYDNGR
jgi:hypothetical protein